MSLRKFGNIQDWDQLNQFVSDFYANVGLDDLRPSNIRTEVPTTLTLDKGRFRFTELDGIPTAYYRSLDGIVYELFSGTSGAAPTDATYLTLSTNTTLTNERVLTAGSGITFLDGGAGSTLTISSSGAPSNASYLTLSLDATLTSERVLTAGTNISFVDSGANGTLTISSTGGSPGGSDTQVQFNDGGSFGGDSDLTWNKTTNILGINGDINFLETTDATKNIKVVNQATSNTAGNNLSITGSNGAGTGNGGQVFIIAGNSGGGATGTGGTLRLIAGEGSGSSAGGPILLDAGGGGTTGVGGSITITSGDGGSVSGNGGNLNLFVGDSTSGNSGNLYAQFYDGTGTNSSGGSAIFSLGAATGSGSPGYFQITRNNGSGLTGNSVVLEVIGPVDTVASGGTITNYRVLKVNAATISGVAGGGTETVTNAATVYIDAAPSGSNITFTNGPYALFVDAGLTRLDGGLAIDGSTTQNVTSGVYTPTRSAEANLDANVTMTEAQYMRVGNTVTVSGRFTADPTLAATTTSFEITLPVASNIGAVEDLAGVAFCGAIAAQGAEIYGSVANDTAVIIWKSADITSQTWSYTFSYAVI